MNALKVLCKLKYLHKILLCVQNGIQFIREQEDGLLCYSCVVIVFSSNRSCVILIQFLNPADEENLHNKSVKVWRQKIRSY